MVSIAAGVRHCHDCGWSGWVYRIALITVIGLLVLVFKKGDPGENRFGKISFLPWAS
ncbi:DUF805 domain-containing protein [Asaia sp. HN010]|uniref:DUF805 domain-containing protein n=1 Tax=Asaia sp. HN010 TaxID=3081233 RepID=UPI0038D2418C